MKYEHFKKLLLVGTFLLSLTSLHAMRRRKPPHSDTTFPLAALTTKVSTDTSIEAPPMAHPRPPRHTSTLSHARPFDLFDDKAFPPFACTLSDLPQTPGGEPSSKNRSHHRRQRSTTLASRILFIKDTLPAAKNPLVSEDDTSVALHESDADETLASSPHGAPASRKGTHNTTSDGTNNLEAVAQKKDVSDIDDSEAINSDDDNLDVAALSKRHVPLTSPARRSSTDEDHVAGRGSGGEGSDETNDATPRATDLERQIGANLVIHNYPELQALIRTFYGASGLKPEMQIIHDLAQKTGGFCLLFESIRCDLQPLRTPGFTLESPDALQALIIKMLTLHILTMCDTMVLLDKGLSDQDEKCRGWKVLNTIYQHWLTKWMLPHITTQPENFKFDELLDAALTNVTGYLKLDDKNHAVYTSVPEHVMLIFQAYRGSWLVGMYTNDLYYSRAVTLSEIAATRMTRAPEQRFHKFSEISEKLKSLTFETIFTTDPLTFCRT